MSKTKNADGRKLVVLSGKTKGTAFVLTQTEVNAGRESDNAICLKGKRVSRHHAVLIRTNGEYTLRDMSPQIGTFLNGRRTKEKVLKVGDRIRIGEFEMRYEAAPLIEEAAAPQEPPVDLSAEHQQRIAELTERLDGMSRENVALKSLNGELQAKITEGEASLEMAHRVEGKLTRETERLVGESKLANETLETVRAELQAQSEQRGDLAERLGAVAQEKTALVKWNEELRAKVSELETSVREMDRVKAELIIAQAALSEMGEDLMKARESAKSEPVSQAVLFSPSSNVEKGEPVQTTPAEVRIEPAKGSDRIAPAVLAKRDVSDPTGEEFDKIRRTIVEKKSLQKPKTLLDRFMLPFRDMDIS